MKKYEYKFEPIKSAGLFVDEYEKIVEKYANEGWRFVTTIVRTTISLGLSQTLDFVFEREINETEESPNEENTNKE